MGNDLLPSRRLGFSHRQTLDRRIAVSMDLVQGRLLICDYVRNEESLLRTKIQQRGSYFDQIHHRI